MNPFVDPEAFGNTLTAIFHDNAVTAAKAIEEALVSGLILIIIAKVRVLLSLLDKKRRFEVFIVEAYQE